ncbi:bifunctional diguanylate cyclase/phosphodiesterase [Oceanibaculum pacificum]|uniref:bifunctional diguanylate cyclase/phosphodiesterase n=1 Tax=Oceanibaculum pacificum TaxID=580166 RepID=UPI000A040DCC|nr:bifunctional diguanylate cyclase/phosphodiesterase [Oceanibaculum pacificum]
MPLGKDDTVAGQSEAPAAAVRPLVAPSTGGRFLSLLQDKVDYAFQPIVNIRTGSCYGYEALLRGSDAMGFPSVLHLFDHAYTENLLHKADLLLREKAIEKFSRLPFMRDAKLFFNLDPRVLQSSDYQPKQTVAILDRYGIDPRSVCFELTERHDMSSTADAMRIIQTYRSQSYRLAIDDFGTGFSGLKLLYDYQPDKVKIDRFFITGIERDPKKKLFVSTIVDLAHVLGIMVIAEGIETEAELVTCRDIGCDMAQGYFIARPTTELAALSTRYEHVAQLTLNDRRAKRGEPQSAPQQIEFIQPLPVEADMVQVFEAFRQNKDRTFFPVIDRQGEPLGIVREEALKDYTYSPYGRDLIHNRSYGKSLKDFVSQCPVAEISEDSNKILEIFSMAENREGILIVSEHRYVGFLSTTSLLRLINEKNIAMARDQNPLTKLPGNNSIHAYIAGALTDESRACSLVYFDFDNFKPFNDAYGFRQGDRAILLFAELMQKQLGSSGFAGFLGHVGGDDFFAGFDVREPQEAEMRVRQLLATFRQDIASFYDAEARENGYIEATDRQGQKRRFAMMTCSAAILHLPGGRRSSSPDAIMDQIAKLKKQAKQADDGVALAVIPAQKVSAIA